MTWTCKPCKVAIPVGPSQLNRIRKHLNTKKHKRLEHACPRCSSTRMKDISECWDRDGIREALKCQRCNTEYKSFAHGISEKTPDEYTGTKPQHIIIAELEAFDREARRHGYIRAKEASEYCDHCRIFGQDLPDAQT